MVGWADSTGGRKSSEGAKWLSNFCQQAGAKEFSPKSNRMEWKCEIERNSSFVLVAAAHKLRQRTPLPATAHP